MTQNLSNDFAIFRYADVLLMKAELAARKSANWNDAVTLAIVNQIRTQHGGVTPFATVTAANFSGRTWKGNVRRMLENARI